MRSRSLTFDLNGDYVSRLERERVGRCSWYALTDAAGACSMAGHERIFKRRQKGWGMAAISAATTWALRWSTAAGIDDRRFPFVDPDLPLELLPEAYDRPPPIS